MMEVRNEIVSNWIKEFTKRVKKESGSKKVKFTFKDALCRADETTPFDGVMIRYLDFINRNPLNQNDYYKYVNAYRKGKKLNLKYFRHDIEKLKGYYSKIDVNPKYNPFSLDAYQNYVLFMMLKLEGSYRSEFDVDFNIQTKDGRTYTPLSKIPRVLRGELPFRVKEYDIARAYPTFIDAELGITDRKEDVYRIIDKVKFNTLLNIHHEVKTTSIDKVRKQLKPIYGVRANEVITKERFNDKGRMFKDMAVYEKKAIKDFVSANNIKNYARLHDGVFVKASTTAEIFEFGNVKFAVKECIKPPIINNTKTYYFYDSENNLQTSPKQYADFFEQENFVRVIEQGNDNIIILKDSNNVVSPFNHKTETVKFLKDNINELYPDEVENRIAMESQKTVIQGYLLLPSKELIYYTDDKNTFGLPFKNGFFKYNGKDEKLECLDYKDVNGFFASHKAQKHEFKQVLNDDTMSVFQRFLTMASTGKDPLNDDLTEADDDTLFSFCSMVGYLCHTHKNRSFSPAIILTDEGANDVGRNGGRGKTILANAISQVQPTITKGGKEFQPNYIHNFADLDISRRVYVIDDVPAGFAYDELYTNIVGSINCQRKGTVAQEIPFKYAPKFIITTNWAVRYNNEETSTNRRFIEFKFTDYFNLENKPYEVFGHTLFDDWDGTEWNRFYNFIYYCVGLYLKHGVKRIDYDKSEDNFIANFSNGSLDEFERVFNIVKDNIGGFTVSDFLSIYNDYQNPMRNERLFNHKNVKNLIKVYVEKHKLSFDYSKRVRKWMKI